MLIKPNCFASCARVAARLLAVVAVSCLWQSPLEAGVMLHNVAPLLEEVNRDIDDGLLQGLPPKINELERWEWEKEVPDDANDLYKADALSTLARYAAETGQRAKAEKYHLEALAIARRALASTILDRGAGFARVLAGYVDFLLHAQSGLSLAQLFENVRAEIKDVEIPSEAKNVLVKRSDAIYALLPRFDTLDHTEGHCVPSAPVTRVLLVGNAHYGKGFKWNLAGPVNDVEILKKSLEVRGVTAITVMTDADRPRMITEMRRLVSETRCGDFVLFHFSGHRYLDPAFRLLTMPTGFEVGLAPADIQLGVGAGPIWNADVSQFLTALRNRGATVVFSLDAGAHALAIEALQERAAKASQWSARLEHEKLLEKRAERGLARVGRNAADYAVFDPSSGIAGTDSIGFEKDFLDSSGQSVTYGVLSYALARVIQTQENPTVKEVAEGLAKEIVGEKAFGKGHGVVVASNPDLMFLEAAKPIKSDTLQIEIVSPKLQEARGAIVLPQPQFELIGRVENSSSIAQLMLDYKPIRLDANGQFKAQIELSAGQNRLTFAAFGHDKSFRTRTLEFTYEGDLDRFAALGEKYALIIGIEAYDSSAVWKPLTTPRSDALAVADLLRKAYGFKTDLELAGKQKHSLVLLDARLQDVTSALTLLRQRLTENDSLLIYYAGHGQRLEDNKVAYWIPKDGKPDDQFTWLSAGQLISELKRMNARSVLVVSDSCFSGAMTREPADLSAFSDDRRRALLKAGSKKSRVFISSGGTEPVLDAGCREDAAHSVFACAFLNALAKADQSIFSSGELHHMYLLPLVSGRAQQQPERKEIADSGHEGGEFVFSKAEAQEAGRRIEDAVTSPR